MTLNLVQHRGEPSVWDPAHMRADWDTDRWMVAVLAGGFLAYGLRRRSVTGLMMTLTGSALAWWASAASAERQARVEQMRAAWLNRRGQGDPVHEAAEESFPASDAPSWTSGGADVETSRRAH